MRWFFALMRAGCLDYILFIDVAALDATWSYYSTGRVFDAARVLSTAAVAGEAGIIAIPQAEADALEERHPRRVWLGACPRSYGPTDPVRLYLLLGLEGAVEGEMCILPASVHGPHGELLCVTGKLLEEVSLEASDF
jgi:hypothetical protein